MAGVTVPASFEQNLNLGDGSAGHPLQSALGFDQAEVPNLYSFRGDEFCFAFQEHGVAYNESQASDYLVDVSLKVHSGTSGFNLRFDPTPVEKWGINFAGKVCVKHESGEEREVYLPGTRTYDPAGITGDPHASERIGPSCSRTQTGVSISELIAALHGAKLDQLNTLQEKIRPLVARYHGRECLFDWMRLQIDEAVYQNKEVTPYPEFIKQLVRHGRLELGAGREHTKAYLKAYNEGNPCPPLQYYQKVAKKDNVEELFKPDDLQKFKKIVK